MLERLGPGGVFGELIAFASLPCDSVTVVCEADCVIVFLPQAQLASCGKSCACHRQLLENLLSLISQKAFALSERVEVLSCRSTREKLLCYFRIRAGEEKSLSFSLPFTLSALAEYLCVDRSAMMRELKSCGKQAFWKSAGSRCGFFQTSLSGKRTCARPAGNKAKGGMGTATLFFFPTVFPARLLAFPCTPKAREQRVYKLC